jgi:hypothetical protein
MTFGQRYYNGNVDICAVGILDADVAVAGLVKKWWLSTVAAQAG